MKHKPFFVLTRLDVEGAITGTSYFYHELDDQMLECIMNEVPDAIIREAYSDPPSIEMFVPQTKFYEGP